MNYKNPYCRKIRGSHLLLVSCGYCKNDIALYQKAGRGRLLRMYLRRIVKSSIDLSKKPGALICPSCKKQLATRVTLKRRKKEAYIMKRGVFNSKEL
ncbi:MAG TPA: hypothetical protein GX526_04495 [Thermoanaerobacterales bacterium]|nr:hypothetical protein [Thermoanaerobacterales bacterium]